MNIEMMLKTKLGIYQEKFIPENLEMIKLPPI